VRVDGRVRARVRLPRGPRHASVPVPVGHHEVRVRARGPGGAALSRPVTVWVLPRSGRRAGRVPGYVDPGLQREVEGLAASVPATTGVYVQHVVTGCGAAVNADAQFPAASTLKAAILLQALRRAGGTSPGSLAGLLDEMVQSSDDRAANAVLGVVGGPAAVTDTLHGLGLDRSLVRAPYIIEGERRPLAIATTAQPALFTNYITTPFELARLMVAVHRGALGVGGLPRLGVSARAVRTEALPRLLDVRDATKLAAGLPAGVPLAHKSGYNTAVKADGGVAYLRRGPVVMAVMTWSAGGVSDATGDPFIARVAEAASRRLARGGDCGGVPIS
jgi:beta-lactamase class A